MDGQSSLPVHWWLLKRQNYPDYGTWKPQYAPEKPGGDHASGTICVVGVGCRKKRMPDCNGLDRGSKFALTWKGADVQLTNHDEIWGKSMIVRCSITRISENLTDRELAKLWENFPWDKAHVFVDRLQKRIAKAVKEGKYRLARRLQYLLTHSRSFHRPPEYPLPSYLPTIGSFGKNRTSPHETNRTNLK